ncbi:MAG: phosphoenolpyruvate synthase [Gammaproteobacteria bacterium]|nr:phosphoenolpyruvate synthase [Gammaproteobacteria bacterium]
MNYIRPFAEIGMDDIDTVGGKNASLGEMYGSLSSLGVKVPNGFAITADGFRYYLRHNGLYEEIPELLEQLEVDDVSSLFDIGGKIRASIIHGDMPQDLRGEIYTAYHELADHGNSKPAVAVRSSATAEDLPSASFAGQQDTYLNIAGTRHLSTTCKLVFASLFTDRAISYRTHHGFNHMDVALSIAVQKMVRSDLASSGVMFTLDTESGFRDVVFITSAYGLGENVVQGTVNPDEFYVFKPGLERGSKPILKRHLGSKELKMVYAAEALAGVSTKNVPVHSEERSQFSVSDDEAVTLARYAVAIERHYSKRAGADRPMDIEWAKDGETGELYIVQARPETVQSRVDQSVQENYKLRDSGEVIAQGKSVGRRIASGNTRVILEAADMDDLRDGEVLVTDITDPDWEPVMKRAAAIVTNRGGRTCHAAIIARELGIPAIVGCGDATQRLKDEQVVTISCAEGDTGLIYKGRLAFDVEKVDLANIPDTRTKLVLNVGNPDQAFETSSLPSDGVGLARLEFIINNSIRVHPRALLEYDSLNLEDQRSIDEVIAGYATPRDYFVERLAEGVGTIAAAFYPRPVIVRLSDFKSNEYATLLGGQQFEPKEENPMLGFRGAGRYFSEEFSESFALECQALKQVRDAMGLNNVQLMVPFVRTPGEGEKVLALMAEHGLKRGENSLQVYLMCELPTNALRAEDFLEHFDGFSIGSNDLTQLTLGIDRDAGTLTDADERDEAVKSLMALAIDACNKHNKYVGICGQAPSDFPEITRWLVERNIQSISLNPDSLLQMKSLVVEVERQVSQTN